ncbi:hypothetical protein AB0323_12815 [Arthrobacter sp. NPDC080031]|uniref:hypothetical protein n=1 Tax=Arthrobacter sp. NPDC080031 TaxID=3155918 RepID=UPI00344CC3E9
MAFADGDMVLVHAEASEVEGLAVDEELSAADLDGTYPEGLTVRVEQNVVVVDFASLMLYSTDPVVPSKPVTTVTSSTRADGCCAARRCGAGRRSCRSREDTVVGGGRPP